MWSTWSVVNPQPVTRGNGSGSRSVGADTRLHSNVILAATSRWGNWAQVEFHHG